MNWPSTNWSWDLGRRNGKHHKAWGSEIALSKSCLLFCVLFHQCIRKISFIAFWTSQISLCQVNNNKLNPAMVRKDLENQITGKRFPSSSADPAVEAVALAGSLGVPSASCLLENSPTNPTVLCRRGSQQAHKQTHPLLFLSYWKHHLVGRNWSGSRATWRARGFYQHSGQN